MSVNQSPSPLSEKDKALVSKKAAKVINDSELLSPADLLESAKTVDCEKVKSLREYTGKWAPYLLATQHFREQDMKFPWIFKWVQEQSPEITDDKFNSFQSTMIQELKRL